MAATVESGQPDSADPDELEDGEVPDSDDETEGDANAGANKPVSQGPALGAKRPFETIWGGQKADLKRSKEESGEEDGEIVSDDEPEAEEFSYHGDNNMAVNTSPQSFESVRYPFPVETHMFNPQFMQPTPIVNPSVVKSVQPAPVVGRNHYNRHGNNANNNTTPSGRGHTTRPQLHGTKREHKPRSSSSKHTALPHPTDPFWGTFRTLLPTPDVPPITGVDLELDYPPLPVELVKEYGLDYYRLFVRDESCGKQQQQHSQQEPQRQQQKQQHPQQQQQQQAKPHDAMRQTQGGGENVFSTSVPTSISLPTPHSDMEVGNVTAPSNEHANHQGVSSAVNHSLADPLNEAFPLIDQREESEPSLRDLVLGTEVDKAEEEKKEGLKKAVSLKKKLKGMEWHRRQSERDKQVKVVKATQPCKFYMHGNCRAGDDCPYSHDVAKEKKREICKYFMSDSCTKGDDCTYYHGPIPCKYHHSSTGCYRGNQCRFSHDPLNEVTSEILQQLLVLKAEKRKQQQQTGLQQPGGGGGFPPAGPDHGMPRAMKPGLLPTPNQPPLTQTGILGDLPPQFHPQVTPQPMPPVPFAEPVHEGMGPPPFHLQQDDPSQPFVAMTDPRTMRAKPSDYPPPLSNENPLLWQQQAPPITSEPLPLFLNNPPPLFPQHSHTSRTDPRAPSHTAANPRVQSTEQPLFQDGHPATALPGEAPTQHSAPTDELQSKRAKYAHLKVKSRQAQSGGAAAVDSQALEAVGANGSQPEVTAEHRSKPPPVTFQMPKSLHDPSILSKPLDPRSLFGAVAEEDSLPFSSQSSSGDSQKMFGEITLSDHSQEKLEHNSPPSTSSSTIAPNDGEATSGTAVVGDGKKKGDDATTLPYYAMFDTGLGGDDLEIDSAFGELS